MVSLQHNKHSGIYFITLPREMVLQKKWVKQQKLFLIYNERGNIEITDSLEIKH